ncbi:piggyBac transposable element-derived protein 4-like [Helicoverpa armigera]|uniref:piggyBac transposable element-derived protein 4-like n=1 Tax=Helicoverpa armigera TaxID=29058 RepID=UPI003082B262
MRMTKKTINNFGIYIINWSGPQKKRNQTKIKKCVCFRRLSLVFFIYIGKTTNSTLPSSTSTVLRLVAPLLNLGHVLFMDNWFNSPSLARFLKRRKTDCVGTLRVCRKNVPIAVQKAKGNTWECQCGDLMVMAYQNRGVDRLDQMLEPYLVERKQCIKWNRKLFKRFLNISIQNSRILVEKSTGKAHQALQFRLKFVEAIANKHLLHVPKARSEATSRRRPTYPLGRLTERHFIQRIGNKERGTSMKTTYECAECGMALCLDFCFKE